MARDSEWSYSDLLVSSVEDGRITVTLGDNRYDEGETEGVIADCQSVGGPDGFYSVPAVADENGSPQAFSHTIGNESFVFGTWDNRSIANCGSLKPGDRAIVTTGPTRLLVKDSSDSINMVTKAADLPEEKDATTGAVLTDMGISLVGDNNGESNISLTLGTSIIQITKDKILLSAGGTQLVIDKKGVAIHGDNFMCNTGGGNLGVLGPGAAPPVGAMSVLMGPMGQAGVASIKWTVS